MSEDDNVVTFRPLQAPAANAPVGCTEQELCDLLQNLTTYCERLEEGMAHVSQVLVAMDARVRKLELAHNKAEREKLTKTAIYNPQGQKVS